MCQYWQIFRHVDATLPKYLLRAYGCDAPVGLVYGINPFMIIFLVPLVGALTTKRAHFDMIHCGSYLSALSPFWIVAFPGHGARARPSRPPSDQVQHPTGGRGSSWQG